MPLQLASGITFRSLGAGQGAVIVDVKTGQLYTCNDTTVALLDAIDGKRSLQEIIEALHQRFDVDRTELEADIHELATDLQQQGIILIR